MNEIIQQDNSKKRIIRMAIMILVIFAAINSIITDASNGITNSGLEANLELRKQQINSANLHNEILKKKISKLELDRDLHELADAGKAGIMDAISGVGDILNTDWKVKTDLKTSLGNINLDLKNKKTKK